MNQIQKDPTVKAVKTQTAVKKVAKNAPAEKVKTKIQKGQKNQMTASNVEDKKQQPVDHAGKVKLIMETTMRSEEQVCWALQECDHDIERAVNMLYENSDENNQWEKTGKKKKNKQQQQINADNKTLENNENSTNGEQNNHHQHNSYSKDPNREFKPRENSMRQNSIRGRRGAGGNFVTSRNREGGERNENRNLESGNGSRRGRPFDASAPSLRGSRGRGASRGTRTFQANSTRMSYQPIETWDSSDVNKIADHSEQDKALNNSDENWDKDYPIEDCYEEYTGSLADTKVFTPTILTDKMSSLDKIESDMKLKVNTSPNIMVQKYAQSLEVQNQSPPSQNLIQLASQNSIQMGSLTPAQTQYFNQLTQQTSENLKNQLPHAHTSTGVTQQPHQPSYASQYSNSFNSYSSNLHENSAPSSVTQNLAQSTRNLKTQQKPSRIPPTSKIPSNPVDMTSSMDYLNVQFSGLDLISNSNLIDGSKDNFVTNQVVPVAVAVDETSTTTNNQSMPLENYNVSKPSITSQIKSDLNSDHLTSISSTYSQNRSSVPTNLSEISKSNDQAQQHQHQHYPSYQKGTNSMIYQGQTYATNNNYANLNNSYSQTNATYPTSAAAAAAAVAAANNLTNHNLYQNNSFSNMSQQFPNYTSSLNQSYYQSQNPLIFGANTGLTSNLSANSSSAVAAAVASQYGAGMYNNHNAGGSVTGASNVSSSSSAAPNKLSVKEQSYENSSTLQSSAQTASNSTHSSTSLSQSTANTTTSKLSNKGMMTNMAPIVSPSYIMDQTTGIPFYQQPAMFTIEDLQMLQPRLPHIPAAGYYEMGYQNRTTLAAGRDATGAPIQNASYNMPDGRFTRIDSSASPVPSTISQQTSNQAHQGQQVLNAAIPAAAYTLYYNAGVMSGGYPYGTALYPQMATATNAHGTTNANQYAKTAGYGSGYNSAYDAMTQSQDFNKNNYLSGSQTQNKVMSSVTTASNSSNDLSMMYAKPHAALGKINSYDTQGYPSGTPQGYNMSGAPATGLGHNAGYATQLYIPTIAPHQQHPNTTMIHQMEIYRQSKHGDAVNSAQRSQANNSSKNSGKQTSAGVAAATGAGTAAYPNSYWNQA